MTANKLFIRDAARFPQEDDHDRLIFKEGVNVIVGEMDAGKTTWLQMIDFVLGDDDTAAKAFDNRLADKYERVTLTVDVAGEEINIERRWKEHGAKTKIFVNNEGMIPKQFSEFIMGKVNIPLIRVPSGNPYSDRTWPELSWRELFRHMYKQELLWSDFVPKQLEVVRSACILHFLDAAKNLYSTEYETLVSKRKEKDRLEAQKDVFAGVVQDFAVEIMAEPSMSIAVTPDSIAEAKQRLNDRLAEVDRARSGILDSQDRKSAVADPRYNEAKQRLEQHHQELGQIESEKNQSIRRKAELSQYARTLVAELERFDRVKSGSEVLADLKVTHCPACDRSIPSDRYSADNCQICGQSYSLNIDDSSAGLRRIDFEKQQITEELAELRKLITELDKECGAYEARSFYLTEAIKTASESIAAARDLAVRAIPPELALLDREAGQILAEIHQADRILRVLMTRDEINTKITMLEEEIANLDIEIKKMTPNINYNQLGDLLSDRMNDYRNKIKTDRLSRWKTGKISIKLRKDSFDCFLDDQKWTSRAGGTANYIIQIAYHYALLSLTKDGGYNYPGFLIIDFPPHFAKADDLRDSETYLLDPFVTLCSMKEMKGAQVIIAGRAFDNLDGANVIRL